MLYSQRLCVMTTLINFCTKILACAAFSWHNKQVNLASQMVKQTSKIKHQLCSNKKVCSLHALLVTFPCVLSRLVHLLHGTLCTEAFEKGVGCCTMSDLVFLMYKLP